MYSLVNQDGSNAPSVDLEVMRGLILQGLVLPEAPVIDPIYGTVRPAGQIPELEAIFRQREEMIDASMRSRPAPPAPGAQYGADPRYGPGQQYGQAPQYGQSPQYGQNPYQSQGQWQQPQQAPLHNPYADHRHYAASGPSDKSRGAALVLAIFLGWLGIHRFYIGDNVGGSIMLALTITGSCLIVPWVIVGIWWFVDIIILAAGGLRDSYGRRLS